MFVKSVMTVLCTAGIVFYVRFLGALRKGSSGLGRAVIGCACDSVLVKDTIAQLRRRQETWLALHESESGHCQLASHRSTW